ncbi:MAG: cytochrome ubiquinol oxidase subunit I [Deltaproteobacteria bacterium]|nr:cytochrome ubiquinol oxidase subunit I [Deltaproteobacteria bacterium]
MSDLLAARAQMAMSLGFHILFAIVGMAMPLLMIVAEAIWLRRGDPVALELAKRWSKGTAILFAVGAVSGTALSFELGLLWPEFMRHAGPVIGMPFSLEGFAFFLEAIFLGIWLYGWDRISPRAHWLAGAGVWICGMASGAFVVCANAWMNTPAGFRFEGGQFVDIDPFAALWNPAAPSQVLHMLIAALEAVGFAVAGIHAWALLRQPASRLHRMAFGIALAVGGVAALIQPISGHQSAVHVAEVQPIKLAAMEAHFHTHRGVPLRVGGWPDEATGEVAYSLDLPKLLSLMAFNDPDAEVRGLLDFPREDWPPVTVTHLAFQIMVGAGSALIALTLLAAWLAWRRRRLPLDPWLLRLCVLAAPLGVIAVEAGWTVTEVGRQPWVIRGVMRTADAVTPMPGLWLPFAVFTVLYAALGVVAVALLRRHVFASTDFASTEAFASADEAGHG